MRSVMPLTGSLRRSLPQRGTIVTRRPYVRCPSRRVRSPRRTTGVGSPPSPFSGTPLPLPRVLTRPSPLNTSFLQPSTQQITHVHHIPIGTCTGFGSSCNAAGVARDAVPPRPDGQVRHDQAARGERDRHAPRDGSGRGRGARTAGY